MVTSTPALYAVTIGHVRTAPFLRTFQHRSHYWLVDIDELPSVPRALRYFVKFESRDHFFNPQQSIRSNVNTFLAEHDIDLGSGRVLMLANARSLGYVFNPLSLFWCYDATGVLRAVIAEVHNTYGGRHAYLLKTDAAGAAGMSKVFYVSPFFDVSGNYEVMVPEPDAQAHIAISLLQHGDKVFTAWIEGQRRPMTLGSILRALLRHPLGSYRVAALIRRHGITLWLRRLPVISRTTVDSIGGRS